MLHSFFRTVLFYAVLILVVRLMGKRQLGQLEPSEFVVTMLVANLAAIPLEQTDFPLHSGLLPIFTVLGLELLLTFLSLRSITFRKLLCGKPVILIENGNILQRNLKHARLSLDELTSKLREKDVLDLKAVQYAILETGGNLSVFPYPKEKPASAKEAGIQVKRQSIPLTIVSDGAVDETWLRRVLTEKRATVKQTYLLTVDGNDKILFYKKD